MTAGNASFTANEVKFKLQALTMGEGGTVTMPEAEDFRRYAAMYNLKPDDLGRTFSIAGVSYTVAGLKTRNRKAPILAKRSDGKMFKMSPETVVRGLAAV